MSSSIKVVLMPFLLVVASTVVWAQSVDTRSATAPVPPQIVTAKKLFISNAGADPLMMHALKMADDPNRHYNEFYNAMKNWAQFELVQNPGDADLVVEISLSAQGANDASFEQQLRASVLDPKTHFVVWTFMESIDGAVRKATWQKNLREATEHLINDWKQLTVASSKPAVSAK